MGRAPGIDMPHLHANERSKPATMAAHKQAGTGCRPSVTVARYTAGDVGESLNVPMGVHALRFPFGRCRFAAHGQGGWAARGEAAAGYVQVTTAGQGTRSEWLSDGEELILLVPVQAWGDQITARMRTVANHGVPRKHGDAVLHQLAQVLAQAIRNRADHTFVAPLVDAILLRSVAASHTAPVPGSRDRVPSALSPHHLARLHNYVQRHLAGRVTLADMAAAVGLSPMYFAAQFRAATGKRPHDYLNELRIQHAQRLMRDTAYALYDVALSVGFNTQAHFCTVFKKLAGVTPRQWRTATQSRCA